MKFKVGTLLAASLLSLTACGGSGLSAKKFYTEASKIEAKYYTKAVVDFTYSQKTTGAEAFGEEDVDVSGSGKLYYVGQVVSYEGQTIVQWSLDESKAEEQGDTEELSLVSILPYVMMQNLKDIANTNLNPPEGEEEGEVVEVGTTTYSLNPFSSTTTQSDSSEEDGITSKYTMKMVSTWSDDGNLVEISLSTSESDKGTVEGQKINFVGNMSESYSITYSEEYVPNQGE